MSYADLGGQLVVGAVVGSVPRPGVRWVAGGVVSVGACERVPGYPGPRPASQELSSAFFRGLWQKAQDWKSKGMPAGPEIFLNVWANESGIRSDTSACNPPYNNAGLNGMGEQERGNVGFHDGFDAWVALTPEEQLPYVLRFFDQNIPATLGWSNVDRAGTLYLLNFLPRYMGHRNEPGYVLAARDGPNGDNHPSSQAWYKANSGLDFGGKGYIEVADMDRAMASAANSQAYKSAVARLYAEGPTSGPLPPPAGSPLGGTIAPPSTWKSTALKVSLGLVGAGALYVGYKRLGGKTPRLPRSPLASRVGGLLASRAGGLLASRAGGLSGGRSWLASSFRETRGSLESAGRWLADSTKQVPSDFSRFAKRAFPG